ncbi:hypothetical protein ACMU_12845 [Actibacterium mucosum KCTC 23349]|uniref:Transcriptional regulator n=1 Tax=Actibacterium mucosum KCTC 23349 TaxID=1454373 RepID=A0A037ZGJ1_9RHOB|nr:WYL domain-containing protein [Actibacterium mucosum]KAJ55575.1 hypothetical protein ACMU_12845 [Actibacterium mucosum KCTC 23349]
MTRTDASDRLNRLDLIEARLKSGEALILADLAAELGVSRRTLSRDIALMRARGVPVEADRGRGGGIRLSARWGVGRMALSYDEAIDLMISLAVAEQLQSPLFMANLGSVRQKLVASFGPRQRAQVARLKSRILVGQHASNPTRESLAPVDATAIRRLHRAFVERRLLQITYSAPERPPTSRVIEPQFLHYNAPVWYVLAWDHLRQDVRTLRCDRITNAQPLGETFELRPFSLFEPALEGDHVLQ